ncbi:hypothetical protein GCM10028857_18960 [Salinarchaeum chitinilyticum]
MPSDDTGMNVDRREMLGMLGAGSTALLAGCAGAGGGTEEGTFTDYMWATPMNHQYNQYNPTNYGADPAPFLFGWLANWDQTNNEWVSHLAENWEHSGDTVTLEISDQYVWHNGDDLTAEDVATKLRVEDVMGAQSVSPFESLTVEDSTTVTLGLSTEINSEVMYQNLLPIMIDTPESVYGEYVEGAEFGSDADKAEYTQELVQFSWDEPIGWGPFEFDRRTELGVEFTKFSDHPFADDINFDTVSIESVESKQQKMQGYLSNNVSGGGMIPTKQTSEDLSDRYHRWDFLRGLGGAFHFNQSREVFQDVRVRQALCHVMDNEPMTANMTAIGKDPLDHFTGFHGTEETQRSYLGDALDSFNSYDDTEQAVTLLEEAGFSRDGGNWYEPSGDRFQIDLVSTSGFASWRDATNEASRQLGEFGIETEFIAEQNSTYLSNTLPNGDFDIAPSFLGMAGIFHPLPHLNSGFFGFPQYDPGFNPSEEYSVPMPVGDAEGSTETVNVNEVLDQIRTSSGEDANSAITRAAWVFNQTMPTYPIFSARGYMYLDTNNWEANMESPVTNTYYPLEMLLHNGDIQEQ